MTMISSVIQMFDAFVYGILLVSTPTVTQADLDRLDSLDATLTLELSRLHREVAYLDSLYPKSRPVPAPPRFVGPTTVRSLSEDEWQVRMDAHVAAVDRELALLGIEQGKEVA